MVKKKRLRKGKKEKRKWKKIKKKIIITIIKK